MRSVYQQAAALAARGEPAAIAVVTSARGHTPQVVGASMLVPVDGAITGTVGGGRFEHEVIERARAIAGDAEPVLTTLHLGAELGMCCGGIMEVLISPLRTAPWLDDLAARDGDDAWLITSLDGADLGHRRVASEGPTVSGERRFEHAGVTDVDGRRVLVEHLRAAPRMLLFGAGHVSGPTARIGAMLGYAVTVIDDRPEWNSADRFPDAERVLDPYEDVLADLRLRANDSVLIITRGHDFDQQVLEAVVRTPIAYLGMIGSKSKVHKAVKRLRAAAVPEADIERLHAPIGLDIGALTPEEIAVSITAELVQVKRRGESRQAERTEAAA